MTMVTLELELTVEENTTQTLKNIGGTKDDADNLEERLKTLEEAGHNVEAQYSNGELFVTIK